MKAKYNHSFTARWNPIDVTWEIYVRLFIWYSLFIKSNSSGFYYLFILNS